MKYFPYLCSVENKTIVIMEKGHKATILTTNEHRIYAPLTQLDRVLVS